MSALDRIDRALNAAGDMLDWACAVIRPALPKSLTRLGHRSVRKFVDIDLLTGAHFRGVLVTSVLGESRVLPGDQSPRTRGVTGILPESEQFRITTELSEAAARAGRAAIALRLESLSPIPVEEAVFAHRRISPAGVVPVQVEVSIARRSSVDEVVRHVSEMDPDWRLVGDVSKNGQPSLEFRRSARSPMGLGLKAVIVSAVVTIALFAWAGRMDQVALDLQASQGQLAAQARQAAAADRQLEIVDAAHQASLADPQIGVWMRALSGLSSDATPFSAIRVTGEAVSLENAGDSVARAVITGQNATSPGGLAGQAAP